MEWFRWYHGTVEDGKFRMIARRSKVSMPVVIALWAMLLEDAAHADHRGVAVRGDDYYAAVLDLDDDVIQSVLESMEVARIISVGIGEIAISKWNERQYESDRSDPTNKVRQQRFRDKQRNGDVTEDNVTRNGDVTELKRPDTDTEADTEADTELKTTAVAATASEKIFRDCFEQNESVIRETFPAKDYAAEMETCIAHYRQKPPPLDPKEKIFKWFNRAFTKKDESKPPPKTFEQIQNESNLESLRKLGERIENAERSDISAGNGKASGSISHKPGRDKGSSILAGIIPPTACSV